MPVPTLNTFSLWLVLLGDPASGAPEDRPYKPLDPQIARVESGGSWKDGERYGGYRAVVRTRCSPEHCYDDLFVEWMLHGVGRTQAIVTKRVAEVGGVTKVTDVRFHLSKRETLLEVRHQTDGGEDKWTFCLTLGRPGAIQSRDGACRTPG